MTSTNDLEIHSPPNVRFRTIWSIGSSSSGASTFNGTSNPVVSLPSSQCSCNPLLIGTDQENNIENIRSAMLYLAQFGPVLLVNSIGYAIDGGKTDTPGPHMLEVTNSNFTDTKLVSKFSQVVSEYPELAGMFWVFNRNYNHTYGKVGGQWANLGYHLLEQMNIPNYEKYKYIADVGGGSVTFYNCDGDHFHEFKEIKMFMSKKNKESPNICYEFDPSGRYFVSKFMESIAQYPYLTKDNLLVLQTGKMRENNAPVPDFNFDHYYLDHHCEVESEAMDIVQSLTQNNPVSSIEIYPTASTMVNVMVHKEETVYEWLSSYCHNFFHAITFGYFL